MKLDFHREKHGRFRWDHGIAMFWAMVALTVLFELPSEAGTIRVSFLRDNAALRETLEILRRSGCTDGAVAVFRRVVEQYYAAEFDFDLSKFPKPQGGFYLFTTPQAVIAALPHKLCDTRHAYELNCFDTVILLAADRLRMALHADEHFGPFVISKPTTNGAALALAATARDAFTQIYPEWYREVTGTVIPKGVSDSRVCLTAGLFRGHLLPLSTDAQGLRAGVIEALRASWRREGIKFPDEFDVVLCHEVNFPQRTIGTTHAGLLFRRKSGYTYLEKSGGSGPFVRLDFQDSKDLLPWLASDFKGLEHEYTHLFATFNATRIEELETPK